MWPLLGMQLQYKSNMSPNHFKSCFLHHSVSTNSYSKVWIRTEVHVVMWLWPMWQFHCCHFNFTVSTASSQRILSVTFLTVPEQQGWTHLNVSIWFLVLLLAVEFQAQSDNQPPGLNQMMTKALNLTSAINSRNGTPCFWLQKYLDKLAVFSQT
jgi:hypothetical protein